VLTGGRQREKTQCNDDDDKKIRPERVYRTERKRDEIERRENMLTGGRDRKTKNIINANVTRPTPAPRKPYHNFGYAMRPIPKTKPKMIGRYNINIETWADIDKQTYYCWGDYWVKKKLQEAFEKLFDANVGVEPRDADFTVYLWGSPYKQRLSWPFFLNISPTNVNICWHYSHPTKMTPDEIAKYHVIFCLSKYWLETIKKWHPNVVMDPLLSCTDFNLPEYEKDDDVSPIDILFIGNARGGLEYGRKAIQWLTPPEGAKVQIYGHKWHMGRYDYMHKWFAGQYWKYEDLDKIYNRAKITLVDGHEDMGVHGFVPMKIFDTLASGGFVLAAYNKGIQDIFGDSVPQYKTKEEMNNLINYFLDHEEERQRLSDKGREIARSHTYEERAQTFVDTFELYKKECLL